MELTDLEKLMDRESLVFTWLLDGKINFKYLSESYVNVLEKRQHEKSVLISGLCIPLAHFLEYPKQPIRQKIFFKCKAAFNLIKSEVYAGTSFENKLKKIVEKYEYSEDKDGIHKIKEITTR